MGADSKEQTKRFINSLLSPVWNLHQAEVDSDKLLSQAAAEYRSLALNKSYGRSPQRQWSIAKAALVIHQVVPDKQNIEHRLDRSLDHLKEKYLSRNVPKSVVQALEEIPVLDRLNKEGLIHLDRPETFKLRPRPMVNSRKKITFFIVSDPHPFFLYCKHRDEIDVLQVLFDFETGLLWEIRGLELSIDRNLESGKATYRVVENPEVRSGVDLTC